MKKLSLKSMCVILLSWFFIIPLTDIVISNFISPESSSILLSMEKGDEIRYKNINVEEEISDIKILFEKEFEENKELASIINKEALMKLDFEENANVLGLFFVEDYYFNLIKNESEERYDNYLTEKGKVAKSILINSLSFEDLFNIQRERGGTLLQQNIRQLLI